MLVLSALPVSITGGRSDVAISSKHGRTCLLMWAATIENALWIHPESREFGAVFPGNTKGGKEFLLLSTNRVFYRSKSRPNGWYVIKSKAETPGLCLDYRPAVVSR